MICGVTERDYSCCIKLWQKEPFAFSSARADDGSLDLEAQNRHRRGAAARNCGRTSEGDPFEHFEISLLRHC